MIYSLMTADDGKYPSAICKALQFLKDNDIAGMEPGKYPIEGDQMFAVVVDVVLTDTEQVKPEAHRRYIDVQYWPDKPSRFGCYPLSAKSVINEAKPENDVWYYEAEQDEAFIVTRPDSFAVFFPEDIHRPDLMVDVSESIRKCVVKIDMALL